jgi:DNA-binding NarL/FixJ family response regulator
MIDVVARDNDKKCFVNMLKVLIAEDHPLFREALSDIASLLADDAQILAVEDTDALLAAMETDDSYDLLLLDYFLPGAGGFGTLMKVQARAPGMAVVIVSSLEDNEIVRQAAALGVAGFLQKSATRLSMLDALRFVLAGGVSFPAELMAASSKNLNAGYEQGEPLTPRQMEVLKSLVLGKSNKEIARIEGISQETVKVHISAILRRLGCSTRTHAVVAARKLLG